MKRDEFLHKYHYYQTKNMDKAVAEAEEINALGIEDDVAVAVMFPSLGYCLMLASAAEHLKELEIPVEVMK